MWAHPNIARKREILVWEAENPHPNEILDRYRTAVREYGNENVKLISTLGANDDVKARIVRYVWERP